jgi:tetratricopeptide (TPR) repeat protein
VFDWKSVVRERLGTIGLDAEKHQEIVEELAQQLESAYEEELAKGADKFAAVRRSMAQFLDWERLRTEVFESVKGKQMPVWEQHGIFAPRRPLVWVCLALSLSFLLLPAFRKALHILPLFGNIDAWDSGAFSEAALQKLKDRGDQQSYAKALAYVALHSPDQRRAEAAAEKAIVLDPQLTWIAARVSRSCCDVPMDDARPWVERLESWDPGNGYAYLLEAQLAMQGRWKTRAVDGYSQELQKALASEPRFRVLMEKTFSAPRMDSYLDRQFRLDRDVLLERGLDYPQKLLMASYSAQIPDLVMLKNYADFLLVAGRNEETQGHVEKALAAYTEVASFGQKLDVDSTSLEHMGSVLMRKQAYGKIVSLLRRQGRNIEARNAETDLAAVTASEQIRSGFDSDPQSTGYRSGQMLLVSALLLILFAGTTLVWIACLAPLRLKPTLSKDMNWIASRLGWAPLLLTISSLLLVVSFWPYARSIAEFTQLDELRTTYQGMFLGFLSLRLNYILDVWIDHMFWPLIWCAAIAILGAVYLRWAASRSTHRNLDSTPD